MGLGQCHADAMTRGPCGRPKSGSGFAGQDERNILRPSIIPGTSTVMMFQSVSLSIPSVDQSITGCDDLPPRNVGIRSPYWLGNPACSL